MKDLNNTIENDKVYMLEVKKSFGFGGLFVVEHYFEYDHEINSVD